MNEDRHLQTSMKIVGHRGDPIRWCLSIDPRTETDDFGLKTRQTFMIAATNFERVKSLWFVRLAWFIEQRWSSRENLFVIILLWIDLIIIHWHFDHLDDFRVHRSSMSVYYWITLQCTFFFLIILHRSFDYGYYFYHHWQFIIIFIRFRWIHSDWLMDRWMNWY